MTHYKAVNALTRCFIYISVVIGISAFLVNEGNAQKTERKANFDYYKVKKANQKIVIDGKLQEEAWKQGEPIRLPYERYPDPNTEAPVNTRCFITYDSENIYIAFKASDPNPEAVRAHLMDRDSQEKLMRDDHVGITIDPFSNGQWGFQFRVNPLGVQADAIYSDRRNSTDYSWNAIWQSQGRITENGYLVELRIPLSSINIPSENIQEWRFSAFRHFPRDVDHQLRSHQVDLGNQSLMAQFDRAEGFRNLSSGLNLEITPVLTAKRSDDSENLRDPLDQGTIRLDPGGNIRWGIRPNMDLTATINPDFSQIEADALQLRENRRFALSFPEKRPFFLEGSEIFNSPLDAVFTRSIVEPQAGVKYTGKTGSHSFGTFLTRDESSRLLFPSSQSSESKIMQGDTYSGIFRYRSQLQDNLSIGILTEGRQAVNGSYHNYVGGIDGYYQFLESNRIKFQYLRSSTEYSSPISGIFNQPRAGFSGDAFKMLLNHSSRNWMGEVGITSITSGFRNDNGFFPRAGFNTFAATGRRIYRGSGQQWYSSLQFGPSFELTTDPTGHVLDRSLSFSGTYNGPLQSEIFTEFNRKKQRFAGRVFSGMDSGVFFFRLRPSDIFTKFRTYITYGETVDFTNVRISKELIIHPGLVFDITRNLNIELDPNFQSLSYRGNNTFNTYLLGTRLIYHFNKELYVRTITQYRYVERNLDIYRNPEQFQETSESFFYQLLFSYKLNPHSKFFLGYSSSYDGINDNPLYIQSRAGFMKVGYVWNF